MTVCIAALTENAKRIVMASDSKVAFGDFSADSAVQKNIPISAGYAVLVSGNDIAYAGGALRRIEKRLIELLSRDPDEIAAIVQEELVETRRRKIEARILRKLGFTTDTFRTEGKQSLSDSAYYDLLSKIDREELSLQLLIVGFDEDGVGHLRIVSADDSPQDWDAVGFAAIGTGAVSALSSLSFAVDHCTFYRGCTIQEVSYHVLAAKFMSESATDVGRATFYVATSKDDDCKFIYGTEGFESIRKSWERHGAPRYSAETCNMIADLLYENDSDIGDGDLPTPQLWARVRKHQPAKFRTFIDKVLATKQLTAQTPEDQR